MADVDMSGLTNPKRPIARREDEAEDAKAAASAPTTNYGSKFSKPFSAADKAKQAEALELALRNRK
jgi:hypothetical protein